VDPFRHADTIFDKLDLLAQPPGGSYAVKRVAYTARYIVASTYLKRLTIGRWLLKRFPVAP
jgi:hypothetical protein